MKWGIGPTLLPPDRSYWDRWYPNGLGPSTFSSPAWQRLMEREMEGPWALSFLQGETGEGQKVTLPVYVRKDRWRRYEITVRPVGYYVSPLEGNVLSPEVMEAITSSVDTYFTAVFSWWLPPWCSWSPEASTKRYRYGKLNWSMVDAFLITLNQPVSVHLEKNIEKPQRRRLRNTLEKGVEVISNPPDDLIQEYYELYLRVYDEQGWSGQKFSRGFFYGVARTLGQGGELIVMKYQQKVVGGGVILYDRNAVHTFQSTIDRHEETIFPHALFNATALGRAEEKGLRYVNFGGINEGNSGLRAYKQAWGAVPTPSLFLRWNCSTPAVLKKMVGLFRNH